MSQNTLRAQWHYPSEILVGCGAIQHLASCCKQLGIHAPMLVTDPALATSEMVACAIKHCICHNLHCGLFSKVDSNPTEQNVSDGVAAYRFGQYDGIIAIGGGSALDCAKAVALMSGQSLPLWQFEDSGENWTYADAAAIAPVIAIPTTAGTGSEVGRAAVITDQQRQVKRIIFHPDMLPKRVILDPQLTVSLPTALTAATGMDALSHNLEALCAPGFHPMADGIALEAIRLIRENLPKAVEDGGNLEARLQMLVASTMGATAFQKGLGAMHALAHTIGGIYNAHHGLLNAILMPYVLYANRGAITPITLRCCDYLGLEQRSFDCFLSWIIDLRTTVGIPHSLSEIGIDRYDPDRIGRMAVLDPSAAGNPVSFSAQQYSSICRNAILGVL
ncbi:iron-containing alcohol dehydrogenase [Marinobacterium jannaschii]|uniref:iron-containing alcohol dehydrogenase n=1 Tax=Marinobacterium jannaschii TaxID=64970 RepID=UPI0004877635|nr:iron-containing alcohol dehydrogenase [Marinobacterium jannaschii]